MSWEEFKEAIIPAILTVVGLWAILVLVLTAGTEVAR
jgi:hypothetical protein